MTTNIFESIPEIAFSELPETKKEEFYDLSTTILDDLLYCNRVWTAWGYGTMSASDFILAAENDDILNTTAETIFNFLQQKN